jgi:putative ABC transport system substrate-binding protein
VWGVFLGGSSHVERRVTELCYPFGPKHGRRWQLKRREFITLLGGAASAWPVAGRAQQKLPTIGFLGSTARWTESPRDAALLERLRELGWIEGRTVAIEHRWAENRMERYAEIATEFVRLRVAVIVTSGTAVPAFKQATSAIPIVFTIDADPVGRGLVASLARPSFFRSAPFGGHGQCWFSWRGAGNG